MFIAMFALVVIALFLLLSRKESSSDSNTIYDDHDSDYHN